MNSDGSSYGGEPSLRNVNVNLWRPDGTLAATTSSGSGNFTVDGLADGWYRVDPDLPSGWESTLENHAYTSGVAALPLNDYGRPDGAAHVADGVYYQTRSGNRRGGSRYQGGVRAWTLHRVDLTTGESLPDISLGDQDNGYEFVAITTSANGKDAFLVLKRGRSASSYYVVQVNLQSGETSRTYFVPGDGQSEVQTIAVMQDRVLIATGDSSQDKVEELEEGVHLYEFDAATSSINPVMETGLPIGALTQGVATALAVSADGSTAVFGVNQTLYRLEAGTPGVADQVSLRAQVRAVEVTATGDVTAVEMLAPWDLEGNVRKLLTFNADMQTQTETAGQLRLREYASGRDELIVENLRQDRHHWVDPLTLKDRGNLSMEYEFRTTNISVSADGRYLYAERSRGARVLEVAPRLNEDAVGYSNGQWVYLSRWSSVEYRGGFNDSSVSQPSESEDVEITLPDVDGLTTISVDLADIVVTHAGVELLRRIDASIDSLTIDAGNRQRTTEVADFVLSANRPLTIHGSGQSDHVSFATTHPKVTLSTDNAGTVSVLARSFYRDTHQSYEAITITGISDGTVNLQGNESLEVVAADDVPLTITDHPLAADRIALAGFRNIKLNTDSPTEALIVHAGTVLFEDLTLTLPDKVLPQLADPFSSGRTADSVAAVFQVYATDDDNDIRFDNVDITIDMRSKPSAVRYPHTRVYGERGNDFLDVSGLNIAARIWGGDGSDTLYGGVGDDQMVGGFGDDVMQGGAGNDRMTSGPGDGSNSNLEHDGNDSLEGGLGNDTLSSVNGTDTLSGDDGDDFLLASVFSRQFDGERVAQRNLLAEGGAGDDTIFGSVAQDSVSGGTGTDEIKLLDWWDYAFLTLVPGELQLDSGSFDLGTKKFALPGFESVAFEYNYVADGQATYLDAGSFRGPIYFSGTDYPDTIIGTDWDDTIYGSYGDDLIFARGGNDLIYSGYGNDEVHGEAGNDQIEAAGNSNNEMHGGAGDDTILASIAHDTVSGGAGTDDVTLQNWWSYELLTLVPGELQLDSASPDVFPATFALPGFESAAFVASTADKQRAMYLDASSFDGPISVRGTFNSDTIIGTESNDTIYSSSGDDLIFARGGNDLVDAAYGDDEVHGGDGDDTILGYNGNDFLNGGMGNDRIGIDVDGQPSDESGNDRIFGGGGNDWLWGGLGADTIQGHLGRDTLGGGAGADIVRAAGDSNALLVVPPVATPLILTMTTDGGDGGSSDSIKAVLTGALIRASNPCQIDASAFALPVTVHGSTRADTIIGTQYDDVIIGNGGDDWVLGAGGRDAIEGNDGNDTLLGGGGDDWIQGGNGDDITNGQGGRDWLSGGDGDDLLTASGPTTLVERVSGNLTVTDTKVTGAGADQIRATIVRAYVSGDYGSNLLDASGASFPVILHGRNGDDTLIGGNAEDRLYGGRGNDQIMGMNGADRAFGGAGRDTLLGGMGRDLLDGEGGADQLMGDEDDDLLIGRNGPDTLNGGIGNDVLFGQAGPDQLFGEDGDDVLLGGDSPDMLDGQSGRDTINGGSGSDDERGPASEVDHMFSLQLNDLMEAMQ